MKNITKQIHEKEIDLEEYPIICCESECNIHFHKQNKEIIINDTEDDLYFHVAYGNNTTHKFELHWLSGDVEIIEGSNISDALQKAGYSNGAVAVLGYYKLITEGDKNEI